jgi:hypothetical protein
MSNVKATDAHQRFAGDLRRIRESYGTSVDDLHQSTKVPRGLIEEFEENALAGHSMFNRVYLRSLVRAYAKQLDLSPGVALRALDSAHAGEYESELADEYLQAEPEPTGEAEEEDEVEREEALGGDKEEGRAAAGAETTEAEPAVTPPEEESVEGTTTVPTGEEERAAEEERAEKKERSGEETAAASAATGAAAATEAEATREAEAKREEKARDQREERSRRSRQRRRRTGSDSTPAWVWAGAVIVVLVAAVGLFFLLSGDGGGAAETGQAGGALAQQDTAGQADEQQPAAPAPEPVQIGDSLDFRVIAARGPVRELRVKRDDELRRPYWIEEGESQMFRVRNQIIFQNATQDTTLRPLRNINLELEGKSFPTDQRDAQGRLVVTRQSAQAHLDSLARQ